MRPLQHRSSSLSSSSAAAALAVLVVVLSAGVGWCQDVGGGATPAALNSVLASTANELMVNFTRAMEPRIEEHFGFCIRDPNQDLNRAFNFSTDMTFLTNCLMTTPDLTQRICTAAEIKKYFNSIMGTGGGVSPYKNCNSSTWIAGCEPGWACTVDQNQNVDFEDDKNIPSRTSNCKPICEGFFSPYWITCMMPCPLGAYCPRATLNDTTGVCVPYNYQPSLGRMNNTCGGADAWADVQSSGYMFCPEGHYCPSTIEKFPCRKGYYCRKGSTSETRCFKSSSCEDQSANQDIKLFGGLVMAALSLLLLIVYNFYDQIISLRERRQAKSREAAARTARQAIRARGRWKAAKAAALKRASVLQQQLSYTFSQKRMRGHTELSEIHGQSMQSITDNDEQHILSNMDHPFEEISDIYEDHNAKVGEKASRKDRPKSKPKHTHSQIFKYAYGQIEKEKDMEQENKNLTFTGVISLAANKEIRSRPLIEIAFKDLTLALKRNKKTLLKCVTGKLKPGYITAVMGPSGAGKTTFLSALTGKTAGCEVTGSVLINGKVEPIRSYKKIIGFVPQDDIVHGNLTVEENLWFSARCRRSADMPRADLVLVVERTIEALGLQVVRNSLVGTVEKRGISGGQKKRVNVGLEMVMEPSLLILDEPTSGLDSSSSQLLLRALRREALEGVNICMVVHQPSFTLFNMFDDLILLAKGGFIAYHGSVKQVEEYFACLGLYVPDRVNPPDYFIDILEGITKPSSSVSVKSNHLPLIWMLHNGYNIPPDMQHDLDAVEASLREVATTSGRSGVNHHSASNEVRDNNKDASEEKKPYPEFNFSKSKDLTNRSTPGIITQYRLYLGRVGKQRLRDTRVQVVDLLILCLAGVCLGLLAKINDESLGVVGYTYTIIAVSLLCKIGALRSFSLEKLLYMRERASGMSSLAYFLAKDTIDHFNTVLKPVFYLSMFYFLNNPRSSFRDNYTILLALVYCVTGIGYTFAICFQPGSAQLWAALLPVVLTLVASRPSIPVTIRNLCYPKWALEAFVIANAGRYPGVWLITRCGALVKAGFDINYLGRCIGILFLYGLVFRCVAFVCLILLHKR